MLVNILLRRPLVIPGSPPVKFKLLGHVIHRKTECKRNSAKPARFVCRTPEQFGFVIKSDGSEPA
jgi:hypothetical protein